MANQGPRAGARVGRAREVEEDWTKSSVRRGLHGCIVAWLHRAERRWLAQPRRRKEIFWGGLVQLRGGGGGGPDAGLRQAQALPWPWEMRLAQNGGLMTRGSAGQEGRGEGGEMVRYIK